MKKALCLYILGSYQLASVTEYFFSDRNFCRWEKTFSLTETFFLWQMCFSDGILDRNLFLWWKLVFERKFFSDRLVLLKDTCFCDINFFLWRKYVYICLYYNNLFLWQKPFSVPNTLFWAFYIWCPVKRFHEKWEFPLSRITKITTLWSPAWHSPLHSAVNPNMGN